MCKVVGKRFCIAWEKYSAKGSIVESNKNDKKKNAITDN